MTDWFDPEMLKEMNNAVNKMMELVTQPGRSSNELLGILCQLTGTNSILTLTQIAGLNSLEKQLERIESLLDEINLAS